MTQNPFYERLARAVVLQAVKDYRAACRGLKRFKMPQNQESYKERKEECERFFLSPYFAKWSTLDGAELLKQLEKNPYKSMSGRTRMK